MAFGYDGSVRIKADLNHSPFDRGLSSMTKQVNAFGGTLRKIGGMVAMAFGTAALINFGKESIKLASDIEEVQNVIDVTFGNGAAQIEEFAKSAAEAFGLSELSAKQYAGTMGAMLKSSGLATAEAQEMSVAMAGLAGDMASFYNLDTDEAFQKIRAGISGETEPLKQLGVNMSVANLEAYALAQGITKSYNAMSQAEQVLLRYNYLLSVTTDAQGDFSRTSGSFANQIRILSLNFDQLKIAVGNAIIPIAQAVLPGINAIISALTKLATVFSQVTALLFGKSAQVKATSGIATSAGAAADATDKLAESTAGAGSAAKQAAKDLKGVLAGFDELNILADNAASSVSGAGGGLDAGLPDLGLPDIDTSGELFSDVTISPKLLAEIEALKDALRRIWEVFKESWSLNGPAVIEAAKRLLTSVYELLKSIGSAFTAAWTGGAGLEFLNAVYTFLATILNIIADIADAWAEAFTNVGQDFFESILFKFTALLELINSISEAFREVWNNGTGVEICETILSILTNINNTIGTIFKKIQEAWEANENGVAIWQAILDIVQDVLGFINELALSTLEWAGELNLEPLMSSFRGLLEAIEPLVDVISGGLAWAYENVLLPFASWVLGEAAPTSVDTLSAAIDALTAILSPLIEGFKLVYSALQPLIEWIQDVAIVIIEGLGDIFRSVAKTFQEHGPQIQEIISHISGAVSAMWENVEPIFNLLKALVGVVFTFWEKHISDKIGAVLDTLDGLIKFVDGVFSGDWAKAWDGIKEAFSAPVKLILGWLGDLITAAKDAAKAVGDFFSSYNSGKASSFSGARTAGGGGRVVAYSLPETTTYSLPRLANGAVIPPNQQFAAILGDQRSGVNVEAPLKTIEQALENVMARNGGFGGDINITVESVLDGKVIARNTVRHINSMTRSAGKPVLLI